MPRSCCGRRGTRSSASRCSSGTTRDEAGRTRPLLHARRPLGRAPGGLGARDPALRPEPRRGVPPRRRAPVRRVVPGGGDADPLLGVQREGEVRDALGSRAGARLRGGGDRTLRALGNRSRSRAARCCARAIDPGKDQSYFLYDLTPEQLAAARFPVGGLTKAEVRAHARRASLPTADKEESQEICFVPAGHARRESSSPREAHRSGSRSPAAEGALEDSAGNPASAPTPGHFRFTIGQRRGIGVAASERLYVLSVDAAANRVVVGQRPRARNDGGEPRRRAVPRGAAPGPLRVRGARPAPRGRGGGHRPSRGPAARRASPSTRPSAPSRRGSRASSTTGTWCSAGE